MPAPGPASALHVRRCQRHSIREAAARCPGCGGFYCRECVTDHGGRWLCAACIAREVAAPVATTKRRRWSRLLRPLIALVVAWVVLYFYGWLLTKIPPSLHQDQAAPTEEDDA